MQKFYNHRKLERNKRGRRIAIGDIHGCFFAFKKLLNEQINITKGDQIFLLGDLIDRGSNSAKVLDFIINLKNKGYQIFPIKGNHEQKLLMAYSCGFDFFEKYLTEYNSLDLLGGELEKYLELIYNFEYCIELDKFFLSHSGINEKRINPFTDLRGMFPKVNFNFEEDKILSKIQIHGHKIKTIKEIKNSVKNKERRFSIDSGCYLDEEEYGNLTALDLDRMKLYHQKKTENITE